MRIIIMPSNKPYPVGYAAYSGSDDFAVSGDGLTWPTGQVSMNTGLGGNTRINDNLVYDLAADVWLGPGKSGGSGSSYIRSTDALGTSWTTYPTPTGLAPDSASDGLAKIIYDFHNQKLIAVDTLGNVSTAPTWSGPWTNTVSGGTLISKAYADVAWIGGQTVVAFSASGGVHYTSDGGASFTLSADAGSISNGGICFNPVTDTWFLVNATADDIYETATNNLSSGKTLRYNGSGTNYGNIVCNPDTGTMIVIDWSAFRQMYRYTTGSGVFTVINSGQGFPLLSFRSILYDRQNARWLLGTSDGKVWASTDDGLTFTVQNGNNPINDGGQFFNTLHHLGYARRYLSPHVVP